MTDQVPSGNIHEIADNPEKCSGKKNFSKKVPTWVPNGFLGIYKVFFEHFRIFFFCYPYYSIF